MENKNSFREKYPKLNIILGIMLVAVIIIGIIWLIKLIWDVFIYGLIRLADITSNLDAVIIVALITGVISILSSIIAKIVEHRNSRREYLTQKREKPYGEFVEMVYNLQKNIKCSYVKIY